MKRLALLLAVAAALVAPATPRAHPLGNFTINRFSRVEASGDRLYVLYVLDLAEIPTFQAGQIDARAYAHRLAENANLTVDGRLAAALFWGAAHALSPGHGKTIVTAYLVGQRGTPRHAALLGLIVTVTHPIGVFALGASLTRPWVEPVGHDELREPP